MKMNNSKLVNRFLSKSKQIKNKLIGHHGHQEFKKRRDWLHRLQIEFESFIHEITFNFYVQTFIRIDWFLQKFAKVTYILHNTKIQEIVNSHALFFRFRCPYVTRLRDKSRKSSFVRTIAIKVDWNKFLKFVSSNLAVTFSLKDLALTYLAVR